MMLSSSVRPSYRWLTVTLCVAIGVYAWYALGQYRRLSDLHQRQLSNAASELKASLETARRTVTEFDKKWTNQPEGRSKPSLCDFDRGQPYLDLETDDCKATPWLKGLAVRVVTSPMLGVDAIGALQQVGQNDVRIRFRFRTDVVLKELAFPDAFGLIFIATDAGAVLYEESPTQRQWLRYLRWGEQTFRDSQADSPPTLQVQNLQHMVGGEDAWNKLRSASSQMSVEIGGEPYHLFVQPLSLDSEGARTELMVGGAVPTSTIIRDALTLDAGLVGVLAFLLLLSVLGFPFIKLLCLDAHERLRLRDINLLYLSSGSLIVLFTCASLAWDGYVRWSIKADAGLESLARQLASEFEREIVSIREYLTTYDKQVGEWKRIDCDLEPVQTRWFADNANPVGHSFPKPDPPFRLRLVSWVHPDNGRQIWKATSDSIQGRTDVGERTYFRAVRDGHLFQMKQPDGPEDGPAFPDGPPFFFGTDRSIANGKFYSFLSMESQALPGDFCGDTTFEGRPIASATVELLSLDQQPLPAGYGFALINREGRTLLHSDRRLSLRENFFDELSEAARARSMVYVNQSGPLKSRYRERPHAFYLRALHLQRKDGQGPAGFYIVAFRDTTIERAVVGRVLVEGLSGPVLVLFAIFTAGLTVLSLSSRLMAKRWSAWLWPHGGLNSVFKWQTIWLGGLLLASVALYQSVGSTVFLVTPLLAALIGLAVHSYVGRHFQPRSRLTARGWHLAAIVLVLVCVVVAPSAALFRLALSHQFAKLISAEREWIAAQEADAIAAAEVQALEDARARADAPARASVRRSYFTTIPAPYDVELPASKTSATEPTPPLSSGVRPIGADAMALDALQGWLEAVMPVNDVIWARHHAQNPNFTYSPDGTLPMLRASGRAILGLLLTLGLMVWWIRWNTERLFFAGEEGNGDAPLTSESFEASWNACEPDEQMVLLQITRERVANPYQRTLIQKLLRKGLLKLNPDLQPSSEEFEAFLRKKERDLRHELLAWEQVHVGHSWHYVRLALVAGVTCIGIFLVVTQPALQSSLVGIATGLTGVMTTGLKARDAIVSWLSQRKVTASS